jgi:hypothetical protein
MAERERVIVLFDRVARQATVVLYERSVAAT